MRYPYQVFVDVGTLQAAREHVFNPCYRLQRADTGTVDGKDGWQCSHFYTFAPARLKHFDTSPTDNPSTRVLLQCESEPVRMHNTHNEQLTFTTDTEGRPLTMSYRIEVSGYQIRQRNPNPIKLYVLDDKSEPVSYQWVAEIEFPQGVFGQRKYDSVWLECAYDVIATISSKALR